MTAEIFSEQGIIVLLIAVVILFGGSKIPQLARSLGQAKKEFQGGLAEGEAENSTAAIVPTDTLHPTAVVVPTDTLHPTAVIVPTDTLHPTAVVVPTDTLHPTAVVVPTDTTD